MGEVHLATMEQGGQTQTVALKRMRVEVAETPAALQQFEREARICALLSHENIVGVRAFGKDAAGPFLALEYVEGRPASQLLRAYEALGDVLPAAAVLQLALDIASGLDAAHRQQPAVIHRDISPDNVLVAFSGVAKVGDFGIAKLSGGTSFTTTGAVKGKFGYMAPELFDGHEADTSTDAFALAATVYQLWCGVTPFRGRTEAEMLRSVLSADPVPMSTLRPGVPEPVEKWVHQTLAKDRAARPAGFSGLISALREVAGGREAVAACMTRAFPNRELPAQPEPDALERGTKAVPAPLPKRRARWPWGLLALPVVAAAAFWLRPVEPKPAPVATVVPPPAPVVVEPPPAAPAPAPVPEAPEPAPVVKATKGSLRVKVKPWGQVFVDGRLFGVTPLAPISLSTGSHQVIVVNEKLNEKKASTVEVRAGKTTELKVVFGE